VGSPHLRLGKFVFRHAKKLSRQHRPISEVRLSDLRKRCPPKNRKNAAIAESKKREADEKPTLIGGPVIAAQKTLGHTRLRRIRPTQIHSVPLLSSRPQLQILLHLARLWLISVCLPRVRLTLELGQLRQQVVEIFRASVPGSPSRCFSAFAENFFDPDAIRRGGLIRGCSFIGATVCRRLGSDCGRNLKQTKRRLRLSRQMSRDQ